MGEGGGIVSLMSGPRFACGTCAEYDSSGWCMRPTQSTVSTCRIGGRKHCDTTRPRMIRIAASVGNLQKHAAVHQGREWSEDSFQDTAVVSCIK